MSEATTRETFLAAFAAQEQRGAPDGPPWLAEQRRQAIARFAERGLPTTRDEEWRYTSLSPLAAMPLDPSADGLRELPTEDAIAPFLIDDAWSRLVFVDGRYVAKLSMIHSAPPGAQLGSLAEALAADAETVRPHLVEAPEWAPGPFDALNAAFWADGALLRVPAGAALAEPVQLLFLTTAEGAPRAEHPRSLIVLERESRAAVVETYAALGAVGYLTNAVTQVVLHPGSDLEHHRIVIEGRRAVHVGQTRVREERASRFASRAITFGGRLVRQEVAARLDAEGAECTLDGLFVIAGEQHVDIHTLVDHARPRATSRQLHKGVLDGRSRGVFNGRVVVRPDAVGTDAHQTNKNLLLADGVEVDSKPQLEIFADDVKCSHGAADGQLAEDAIFYLKSRGLDEAAARTLLTQGFANEVLARIRSAPVRRWCERQLAARLRDGRVQEHV
jgi:Fe-S cluster assembly protein SufD